MLAMQKKRSHHSLKKDMNDEYPGMIVKRLGIPPSTMALQSEALGLNRYTWFLVLLNLMKLQKTTWTTTHIV